MEESKQQVAQFKPDEDVEPKVEVEGKTDNVQNQEEVQNSSYKSQKQQNRKSTTSQNNRLSQGSGIYLEQGQQQQLIQQLERLNSEEAQLEENKDEREKQEEEPEKVEFEQEDEESFEKRRETVNREERKTIQALRQTLDNISFIDNSALISQRNSISGQSPQMFSSFVRSEGSTLLNSDQPLSNIIYAEQNFIIARITVNNAPAVNIQFDFSSEQPDVISSSLKLYERLDDLTFLGSDSDNRFFVWKGKPVEHQCGVFAYLQKFNKEEVEANNSEVCFEIAQLLSPKGQSPEITHFFSLQDNFKIRDSQNNHYVMLFVTTHFTLDTFLYERISETGFLTKEIKDQEVATLYQSMIASVIQIHDQSIFINGLSIENINYVRGQVFIIDFAQQSLKINEKKFCRDSDDEQQDEEEEEDAFDLDVDGNDEDQLDIQRLRNSRRKMKMREEKEKNKSQTIKDSQLIYQTAIDLNQERNLAPEVQDDKIEKIDPFKLDLFNVGCIMLYIESLRKHNMTDQEIKEIMKSRGPGAEIYKLLDSININHLILVSEKLINIEDECSVQYKLQNFLQSMLDIEFHHRISSIKLALVCQLTNVFQIKYDFPYRKMYSPVARHLKEKTIAEQDQEKTLKKSERKLRNQIKNGAIFGDEDEVQTTTSSTAPQAAIEVNPNLIQGEKQSIFLVSYKIKPWQYEGEVKDPNGLCHRHGQGSLYRTQNDNPDLNILIYKGEWADDLPDGEGNLRLYQQHWWYRGSFRKGKPHGFGRLLFFQKVIFEGDWNDFFPFSNQWIQQRIYLNQLLVEGLFAIVKKANSGGNDTSSVLSDGGGFSLSPNNIDFSSSFLESEIPNFLGGKNSGVSASSFSIGKPSVNSNISFSTGNRHSQIKYAPIKGIQPGSGGTQFVDIVMSSIGYCVIALDKNLKLDQKMFLKLLPLIKDIETIDLGYFTADVLQILKGEKSFLLEQLVYIKLPVNSTEAAEFMINYLNSGKTLNLKALDFGNSKNFDYQNSQISQTIVAQSKTLFFLEELYFTDCKGELSKYIGQITVNSLFDNIKILDVSQSSFDDKGLKFILESQYGQKLHSLVIANCHNISCEGLTYFAENLSQISTNLMRLDISGMLANVAPSGFFTDSNLKAMKRFLEMAANLQNLVELILDGAYILDGALETLGQGNYINLMMLSLKNCSQITAQGLTYIHSALGLNRLRDLRLDNSSVNLPQNTAGKIQKVQVSIIGCKFIDPECLHAYVRAAQELRELSLEFRFISSEMTTALASSTLQKISLKLENKSSEIGKIIIILKNKEIGDQLIINLHGQHEFYFSLRDGLQAEIQAGKLAASAVDRLRIEDRNFTNFLRDLEDENLQRIDPKQFLSFKVDSKGQNQAEDESGNDQRSRKDKKSDKDEETQNLDSQNQNSEFYFDSLEEDFFTYFNHPDSEQVQYIDFSDIQFTSNLLKNLLQSPYLINVEHINCTNKYLLPDDLISIEQSKSMPNLKFIDIFNPQDNILSVLPQLVWSQNYPNLKKIRVGQIALDKFLEECYKHNFQIHLFLQKNYINPVQNSVEIQTAATQQFPAFGLLHFYLQRNDQPQKKKFVVHINRFVKIEIKDQFTDSVFESENRIEEEIVNILVLGKERSGKSALIKRYLTNTFDPNQYEFNLNLASFSHLQIEFDKIAHVSIFQIFGSDIQCPQNIFFYEKADIVFIIVDLTLPDIHSQIYHYIEDLHSYHKDISVHVIATQNDLTQKQVTQEELREFCKQYQLNYTIVSAESGENVQQVFETQITNSLVISKGKYDLNFEELSALGIVMGQIPCYEAIVQMDFIKHNIFSNKKNRCKNKVPYETVNEFFTNAQNSKDKENQNSKCFHTYIKHWPISEPQIEKLQNQCSGLGFMVDIKNMQQSFVENA